MLINKIFNYADRLQMESLNHRSKRSQVIDSNIANAETPGFRALGYDFEEQLQEISDDTNPLKLRSSNPRHQLNMFTDADGTIRPDVYIRPTESVGHDGNTVDTDKEMSELAQNQILFRAAVETINRKIAMINYAITGGGS